MRPATLLVLAAAIVLNFVPTIRAESEAIVREVRAAETAFAKTMADRDLSGFLEFVAPDAVFFGNGEVLRGVDAVKPADGAGSP